MSYLKKAKVKEIKNLAGGYVFLRVDGSGLAKPNAGQFYTLSANDPSKVLNRPMSLNNYNEENCDIDFLIKIDGKGTQLISKFSIGDEVTVQGPLGKGFDISEDTKNVVLVGGGVGISPLGELTKKLHEAGKNIYLIVGARNKTELESNLYNFERFTQFAKDVIKYTDDGSGGYNKGFVIEGLNKLLSEEKPDCIYTCGPIPMLKGVSKFGNDNNIKTQISLESRMGCGVGGCFCCSIKTTNGNKRVCKDGPVFKNEELIFL